MLEGAVLGSEILEGAVFVSVRTNLADATLMTVFHFLLQYSTLDLDYLFSSLLCPTSGPDRNFR